MKSYTLHRSLYLPRPLTEVFAFFSNPRNLARITPPWLGFRIRNPGVPTMKEGLLIDYRITLYGLPLGWQSRISMWDPPYQFVDEQTQGPYWFWRHHHRFHAETGGTRVVDDVTYNPRGGGLIHHWFVRPQLERIFDYRGRTLLAWCEQGA